MARRTMPSLKADIVSIREALDADLRGEFNAWFIDDVAVCRYEWRMFWTNILHKYHRLLKQKERRAGIGKVR